MEGQRSALRVVLLAGFGLAALLLAAAALPPAAARTTRTGEALARRRAEIGLLGATALVAFAVAYLVATLA